MIPDRMVRADGLRSARYRPRRTRGGRNRRPGYPRGGLPCASTYVDNTDTSLRWPSDAQPRQLIGSHARPISGDISSCSASRARSLACRRPSPLPPLRPAGVALTFVKPTPRPGVLVASASYLSPTTTLNRPSSSSLSFLPSSSFHPLSGHSYPPSLRNHHLLGASFSSSFVFTISATRMFSFFLLLLHQRVLQTPCHVPLSLSIRPFVRAYLRGSIVSTCRCLSVRATARISRRTFTIALKPLRILSLSTHACFPPFPRFSLSCLLLPFNILRHPAGAIPTRDPRVPPPFVR